MYGTYSTLLSFFLPNRMLIAEREGPGVGTNREPVRVPSGISIFVPQPKHMQVGLLSHSKLPGKFLYVNPLIKEKTQRRLIQLLFGLPHIDINGMNDKSFSVVGCKPQQDAKKQQNNGKPVYTVTFASTSLLRYSVTQKKVSCRKRCKKKACISGTYTCIHSQSSVYF